MSSLSPSPPLPFSSSLLLFLLLLLPPLFLVSLLLRLNQLGHQGITEHAAEHIFIVVRVAVAATATLRERVRGSGGGEVNALLGLHVDERRGGVWILKRHEQRRLRWTGVGGRLLRGSIRVVSAKSIWGGSGVQFVVRGKEFVVCIRLGSCWGVARLSVRYVVVEQPIRCVAGRPTRCSTAEQPTRSIAEQPTTRSALNRPTR